MGNSNINRKKKLVKKESFLFSLLLSIILLLTNCLTVSAGAKELQKIVFLPMWLPQPQFAGYYMAKEKGIYEKYGLDVTLLKGGPDKDVAESLNRGEIHFGIMNLLSAIQKKEKGLNLISEV